MIAGFDNPTTRLDLGRRPADGRHPGQPPPDQHGVPELRHLPASERRAERRLRAEAPEARSGGGEAPRRGGAGAGVADRASASAARPSFPAASASASRSPARWSCGRKCCCSTSRCRRSTRSCASRCRSNCAACSRRSASPSCWSPTTSTRRWRMSDRIAVMFGGRIAQVASPKEIYQRPVNRQVADFLGGMNFVKAEIVEENGATITLDTPRLRPRQDRQAEGLCRATARPPRSASGPNGCACCGTMRQRKSRGRRQGRRAPLFRRDHPSDRRGARAWRSRCR